MKILSKGSKGEDVKALQIALHLYPDGIFGRLTEEAVKEFQRAHGIPVDGVVGEKTWEKITGLRKSRRTINEIIVHCTATKEGSAYTVDDITRWHKLCGWATIGYHYVVYLDGSVHDGRNVDLSGAHCTGHNTHSIGVCYIGGCAKDGYTPKDTRTKAQKESLLKLLKDLKRLYPKARIRGHRDFANKACPSFDATKEYKSL